MTLNCRKFDTVEILGTILWYSSRVHWTTLYKSLLCQLFINIILFTLKSVLEESTCEKSFARRKQTIMVAWLFHIKHTLDSWRSNIVCFSTGNCSLCTRKEQSPDNFILFRTWTFAIFCTKVVRTKLRLEWILLQVRCVLFNLTNEDMFWSLLMT